jgi:RNA polymerase-associated protein RTF1
MGTALISQLTSSPPSTPSSLQSAPMDESDSEGEAAPLRDQDDENKYPVEGMFINLAEKNEIMSMREVEREQILAERAQEKDRILQNKLLRQLVSNEEQRKKKRSASDADLEATPRKTTRVRTKVGGTKVGETNAALDTLKTRRAEKNERTRRREEDRERRKDRSPSYRDERSEGEESEVEWASPTKKKQRSASPEFKEVRPAELRDVERVRMSRSRFSQVCFYPGFEDAMRGCYVRIAIGPDPATREDVYRMAVIKGVSHRISLVRHGEEGANVVQAFPKASRTPSRARRAKITSRSSTLQRRMESQLEIGLSSPARSVILQRYVG